MGEHHWCIVLLLLVVHWWGLARCCNHSLRLEQGLLAQVWPRWLGECLYLQIRVTLHHCYPSTINRYKKLAVYPVTEFLRIPEDGVMGVMGVAIIPLALSAAICCICTAATVATGDRYADWATRACCWTSCRYKRKVKHEGRGGEKARTKRQF